MRTTDLIESLAGELRPVGSGARASRLGTALALGALVSSGIVWAFFGVRPDLAEAALASPFWIKCLLAWGVGGAAFALCARLSRPEARPGLLPLAALLPAAVVVAAGLLQLGAAEAGARRGLWLGQSAAECPWNIALLSVPILAGVLWALRRFAPTRLRFAGFSAGLLAGGAAAGVYALHCPESAAAFVATWYTAGILIPAALGSWIGPRLLRW